MTVRLVCSPKRLLGIALGAMSTLVLFSSHAGAAELVLPSKKFEYFAERKDLKAFLREFASSLGIQIAVDPEVQGTLVGRYELPPRQLLAVVCNTFGLEWYYDGRVLHIEPTSAAQSEVIHLKYISPAGFIVSLAQLGISDKRFVPTVDQQTKSIFVSGPRKYVELVKQAAAAADRVGPASNEETAVRVFPLKYAFADDSFVRHSGREFRVPGVATTLQKLYAPSPQSGQPASKSAGMASIKAPLENKTTRMKGTGLSVKLPPKFPGPEEFLTPAEDVASQKTAAAALPSIVADQRTNAIVVRDSPSRLNSYEPLIRSLDVRPSIVELEASIVEVVSDDVSSLGIDWRLAGSRVDLQSGSGSLLDPVTNPRGPGGAAAPFPQPNPLTLGSAQGAVLATILGSKTQFLARLSALEGEGKAWIKATPKVMTLNNIEAVLEAMETFFARVNGFQDSQLYDISVGVSMRVTPMSMGDAATGEMRLLINIDDGAITDRVVDQLPVIQKSTIATQAMLKSGQSLLIAGYTRERRRETTSGVPGLSSLPVVGRLFSTKDTNSVRLERMFLLTPRLIEVTPHESGNPS